jgi:hypothetical protein
MGRPGADEGEAGEAGEDGCHPSFEYAIPEVYRHEAVGQLDQPGCGQISGEGIAQDTEQVPWDLRGEGELYQ